jgi:hypothetical protein
MAAAAAASGEYGPKQSVNSGGIAAERNEEALVHRSTSDDFFSVCVCVCVLLFILSSVLFHAFVPIINFDRQRKEEKAEEKEEEEQTHRTQSLKCLFELD